MNLEFESAFNRQLSPQEKLAALARAEQWGWEARDGASSSTNTSTQPQASGSSSGLLAQISLYLSILHGRTTEVSSRLGVPPAETTRKKVEAVNEIFAALDEIRERCTGKVSESEKFAKTWVERLGGTWIDGAGQDGTSNENGHGRDSIGGGPATPAVVTTPPTSDLGSTSSRSTVTTPPAASATLFPSAAELDSAPPPRASMADLSYFAELDISGRLVPARYIQRDEDVDGHLPRQQRPVLQQQHQPQQQQQQQERQSLFSTYNYDINSDRDPGLGVSLGLGGPSRFSIADYHDTSPPPKSQPQSPPPQQQQQSHQSPRSEKAAVAAASATTALSSHPPSSSHHHIPEDHPTTTTDPNEEPPPAYSPYLS